MQLKFKAKINDIKNYGEYGWFTNLNKLVVKEEYPVRSIHITLQELTLDLHNEETSEFELVSINPEDVDFTLYQLINEEWTVVEL